MDARRILLQYLRRKGISQEELSRRVGLHRVTMTRYLNYTIDLAGDRLIALMNEAGYEFRAKRTRNHGSTEKGERQMNLKAKNAPYGRIREMVEAHGGTMTFHAGGGPGGSWRIELQGRVWTVDVRDRKVNDLDRMYASKIDDPQSWDDYMPEPDCQLKPDAFWRLVKMIELKGEAL